MMEIEFDAHVSAHWPMASDEITLKTTDGRKLRWQDLPAEAYHVTLTPIGPELKRCPFCGGKLEIHGNKYNFEGGPVTRWWIACENPACCQWESHLLDSREIAVKWASRRVP
jgi:hypothetical protein